MRSDGKGLEGIVSFVERTLLPKGFDVRTNKRIYNDDGAQIAEFDIEIRGKVGSTEIAWLIECRDRPGQGSAPGSWIEQLVGRRTRFGFNKVTAVSTTGFAAGAAEFAQREGIELREVKSVAVEEFAGWLAIGEFRSFTRMIKLDYARLLIDEKEDEDKRTALTKLITESSGDTKFLRSSINGELASNVMVFHGTVLRLGNLFDDLEPNGPRKPVAINACFSDEDHYIVDTSSGPVDIKGIVFRGEIYICEKIIPLVNTAEYRSTETGEPISQVAIFEPQKIHGVDMALEFHHMADTGETHVILRKTSSNLKGDPQ